MKFSKVVDILIKAIQEKHCKESVEYFLDAITFWTPCWYPFDVF